MLCVFCLANNGIEREAVALAASTFRHRPPNTRSYEFHPVCWDHLSTWNDGAEEKFPVYQITCLDGNEMEHHLTVTEGESERWDELFGEKE